MFAPHASVQRRAAWRQVVFGFAALVSFAALLLSAAYASDAPAPGRSANGSDRGTAAAGPWPAPVGHRQPRAVDIPASVPKDESDMRIERLNREVERRLQICRC